MHIQKINDPQQERTLFSASKMDFKETGWRSMGWILLAQDRDQWQALMNMVINLQVP
jgi:hypothetical protein